MPTLEEQIEIIKKRKEQIITRERELVRRQKEKERKLINKKIFAIGRAIHNEYETDADTEFLDLDQEELIQKVRLGNILQVEFQENFDDIDPNLFAKYIGQYHQAIINRCIKKEPTE